MCGICGKVDLQGKKIPLELITSMTNSLDHRGPDDFGIYQTNQPFSVSLGHRRLSIIDLSPAGKQPMSNEENNVWLVFNGEIYNHQELRKELGNQGHRFSSHTDSEVIIHLYEQEGIKCLEKLNGMFAFCLWDLKNQTLYLCRDRAGIKPLVYSWNGTSLSFASEIRSLLCDPATSTEMDHEALNLYLTFNYIPAPFTIYKSIKKLEGGTYLMLKNNEVHLEKYWGITAGPSKLDFQDAQKKLYSLLEDAVRMQCKADVPLGAFLSGGIDSSIVVGLMSKIVPKVKTFSIGFPDMPILDESSYAQQTAEFFQTDHTPITLHGKDILGIFTELLSWFDEPFADSSAIPTFIVSRETRQHVKVALSGDGGDELFAGYRMYTGEYWNSRYQKIPSFLRQGMIEPLLSVIPDSRDDPGLEQIRRVKKLIAGKANTFEERYFLLNQIFHRELRENILKAHGLDFDTGKNMTRASLNSFHGDNINRMLYCDFKNSLPNDMLAKVDSMSMKNGLEVRVPLLDHRVVEFIFNISGDLKLKKTQGKYILRETFKHLLPPDLLKRPKSGFEVPISSLLKTDLKFLIDEHLSESKIKKQDIFHHAPIKKLIDDLLQNRRDTSWQLWNLIVFQSWSSR